MSIDPKAQNDGNSTSKRIEDILAEIEKTGVVPDLVFSRPGEFLRDFYESWYINGGQEGGRPRNSIRRMRGTWLVNNRTVRSLHPKLIGQVRIFADDARALIDLFLQRWLYVGSRETSLPKTEDGYTPYPSKDRNQLSKILIDALFNRNATDGLLLPARNEDQLLNMKKALEYSKKIEEFSLSSNAIIIHLKKYIAIEADLFWHSLNFQYQNYINSKNKSPIIIYVVDIGNRVVEDKDSVDDYFSSGYLALNINLFLTFDSLRDSEDSNSDKDNFLFKYLAEPNSALREDRCRWMLNNVVIVVKCDQKTTNINHQYSNVRFKDIGITYEHIMLTMAPPIWSAQLRKISGYRNDKISETITVFYKDDNAKHQNDIRYFAYSSINSNINVDHDRPIQMSIELASPGSPYDDANRILYWAAQHCLGRDDGSQTRDTHLAAAYLEKLGFSLLRIPDFLRLFWTSEPAPISTERSG